MIRYSWFDHAQDGTPKMEERESFAAFKKDLVDEGFAVVGSSQEDKRHVRCLSPAEFLPEARSRHLKNVVAVHFGMLDFDGPDGKGVSAAERDEILQALEGLDSFFYTTHGHAKVHKASGAWKFRAGFAFSRPVAVAEWPRVSKAIRRMFSWRPDPKCSDAGHIYFVPCVPDAAALDLAVLEVADGEPLDIDSLLGGTGEDDREPPSACLRSVGVADAEFLAGKLAKSKTSPMARRVAKALAAVAKGDPDYAPEGERDEMLWQSAAYIARSWPDADPGSVEKLFRPAVEARKAAEPDAPDMSEVIKKIDRELQKARAEQEEKARQERDARAALIRTAFHGRRDIPYTAQELEAFASDAGCSEAEFRKRWILEHEERFWLFQDGGYLPKPVTKPSLWIAAESVFAAAETVDLRTITAEGHPRRKTPDELVEHYGTHIQGTELDLRAKRTRYDSARGLLVEAPCPLRDLEPERSEAVEFWLEAFAGKEKIGKLLDWLATATRLDRATGALCLFGKKGAGKTVLANGIARLWSTTGATPMESLVGGFNDAVLRCPLVFADEKIPPELSRPGGSGWLRQVIAGTGMKVRRKYRPEADLKGAVRVVFAANNNNLLQTAELLSADDAEALADRYIHIPIGLEGREALALLREESMEDLKAICEGDAIAKHVLWLERNRIVVPGSHLLVQGESSYLERSLLTSSPVSAAVVEWCLGYLTSPKPMDARKTGLVRVERGRLLVNTRALTQHWDEYVKSDRIYGAQTLADALAAVSDKDPVRLAGADGQPVDYRAVRTDVLRSWGPAKCYATEERIEAALGVVHDREPGSDDCPF